jgi:LuxR family transcriptional regulator, glucitol operon activator
MDNPLSRRDIGYTVISRFEETFRDFISEKLLMHFGAFLEGIPAGIIAKATDRSTTTWDDAIDFLEDTDFPDLKEIVCYKGMYANYFNPLEFSKKDFENLMEEIYNLRCKIAHVKGYFTSLDLDKLFESTLIIAGYLEKYGDMYVTFVKELKAHPERIVIPTPIDFSSDDSEFKDIPNNIPTPDYEYEGGFVGREDDIKKVIDLLEGDLHRVITISGAGGVGKTSLALRGIQKIVRKSDRKFDGVVWLSAKETKLSYLGIEDIEPSIKNYEELLDTIFEVMGFGNPSEVIEQKETDVQTIFDLHQSILIVIDNLETITDERIINFILDAHKKTKILITSRRGLGQVERRYDLKQLKEKEAIYLFRQISKDKYLTSLVKLDDTVIKTYVKKVSYYPLAIKWVVGQVALGRDINRVTDNINETTSDISHFCFDQIYHGLTTPAKKLLCALSCFDEPPPAGVLQYVVDINQDLFEDTMHELILVSLVIPEQYKNEQNEIARRYILLSLTRGYVREQLDGEPVLKRDIEERLRTVQNTIEEAERAARQYRFSLSNLGATTEEEKVAAMIAQTAFQKYQTGKYVDAFEDYKRACQIAPRFASLYRNWAVMESQEGHSIEADNLMEKAAKLNPKDPQIWLTWGNMKRRGDKIKEALERYEKAYALSPEDVFILNALGQAKVRLGEYAKADELFRRALQKETFGASVRHEIVNRSSLADNLSRWAESLSNDRNYKEAEIRLKEALEISESVVKLDKNDPKSLDLLRRILIKLGYFYKKTQPHLAISYFTRAIVDKPARYREVMDTAESALQAAKLYYQIGDVDRAKEILPLKFARVIREPLKRNPRLQQNYQEFWQELFQDQDFLKGKIISIDFVRNFAIIESIIAHGNTYLGHLNDFQPRITSFSRDMEGKNVSFSPKEVETGKAFKKIAKIIRFLD